MSVNWNHYLPWFVQLSALIGVVWPFAISLFNQAQWSPQTKRYVAVGVSLVAAIIITVAKSELTLTNLAGSFTALYAAAHVFYEGLWKQPAQQLEVATTLGSQPSPAHDNEPVLPPEQRF